jgi:hypothetical protein
VIVTKAWRWLGRACQTYVIGVLVLSFLASIGLVTGHDGWFEAVLIVTLPTGPFVYTMVYIAGAAAFTVLGGGTDPSTLTAVLVWVPLVTVAFTATGLVNAAAARSLWLAYRNCRSTRTAASS